MHVNWCCIRMTVWRGLVHVQEKYSTNRSEPAALFYAIGSAAEMESFRGKIVPEKSQIVCSIIIMTN